MAKPKVRITVSILCIIGIALLIWSMASTLAKADYNALGLVQYEEGNYDKAIGYYSEAIQSDPTNAEACHNRGLTYYRMGNRYTPEGMASLKKAISDFNQAITLKPDYVDAYYHRGLARIEFVHFYASPFGQEEINLFNDATTDFNKALELDETFYLAYAGLGNACDRYGKFLEAVKWYNTALENQDTIKAKWGKEALAAIYYSRGRAYHRVENPQVIADYKTTLELNPNCEMTLSHLPSIYKSIGRYDDAIELYNRCVKLKEQKSVLGLFDFHAWDGRGECYYKLGEYDKAIQDFNKTIEAGKRPILPALLYLGKTYLAMGEDDKAGQYFGKVIGVSSDAIEKLRKGERVWLYPTEDYALYNYRGLAYLELGQHEKALSDFEKVVALSPEFPRGHVYYSIEGTKNIGITYLKMGVKEEAKKFYQEALSIAKKQELEFTQQEVDDLIKEL
jgi:tetratricopeptide (TPR) repeat protein